MNKEISTVVDKEIASEVAHTLLEIHAVTINVQKPFLYASGIFAPIYTDNRLLISHPAAWSVIIDKYAEVIQEYMVSPDVLSGTATAAIPHAAVLAHRLQIPMVYVRSSKKEHGKENQIEGEFKSASTVLIVEDLISTGKSIETNIHAIRGAGGTVTDCIAITTSTVSAFQETIKNLDIRLVTLTNIQTVLTIANQEKYISDEDLKAAERFLKNPQTWGRDMGFV